MNDELGHGPRLSDEEYDRRVVELYRGLSPDLSSEQEAYVRRQELELAIDHRLGKDFPHSRRDALWAIQQRVERRRTWLMARHILRWLLPGGVDRGANRLASYLVKEYEKELTRAELQSFFRD